MSLRVAFQGFTHRNAVDRDGAPIPADDLSGKRKHALQHRHTPGEVTAVGEESRERFGRTQDDKLADAESRDRCWLKLRLATPDWTPVVVSTVLGWVTPGCRPNGKSMSE
jgi:hypothetical protein